MASKSCDPHPRIEADEVAFAFDDANNGASPLWCIGSTCIVRTGDDVLVSGIEKVPNAVPLNNVRWMLLGRAPDGWKILQKDLSGRTREPCPIGCFDDGRILLSVNPTLAGPSESVGPSDPHLLEFSLVDGAKRCRVLRPIWEGTPEFNEHSYRALAVDGDVGELLICQNVGDDAQHWSFCDREGNWLTCGKYLYPLGQEYEHPVRLRLCYHNVALLNRAAHFFAVSDIAEPCRAWREVKASARPLGQAGDWVFRRLYYYWTPDIVSSPPGPPIEIANVDSTAGMTRNLDLWIDPTGRAHLLWLEKNIAFEELRDRFFPDTPIQTMLKYAIVANGEMVHSRMLVRDDEQEGVKVPGWARLHPAPDGRLYLYYCTYDRESLRRCNAADPYSHTRAEGLADSVARKNHLMEITPDPTALFNVEIPIQRPFARFMTASPRAGCKASPYLDLLGMVNLTAGEVRYVRIRA